MSRELLEVPVPGPHPEPPPQEQFDRLDLWPLLVWQGGPWVRIYQARHAHKPLHFGRNRRNRFNAPDGEYGVLYLGCDLACAFIETLGWRTGIRYVSQLDGLYYPSRHNNHRSCVALYDRDDVSSGLSVAPQGCLLDNRKRLAEILDTYGLSLA